MPLLGHLGSVFELGEGVRSEVVHAKDAVCNEVVFFEGQREREGGSSLERMATVTVV